MSDKSNPSGAVIGFYSVRGGVGRTMAMCNTAAALALSGARVLVVDVDSALPSLWRYLRRFLPPSTAIPLPIASAGADVGQVAQPLDLSSVGAEGAENMAFVALDPGDRTSGEGFGAALRASSYDYVLVNLPPGADPTLLRWMSQVFDVVVTCFTMSPLAIGEAVEAAAKIRAKTSRDVRVIPLPAKVDLSGGEALEDARLQFNQWFSGMVVADLEVPYQTGYSFTDMLAVLNESAGDGSGLRKVYERLAGELSGATISPLGLVNVVFTPRYQTWAEWIAAQLWRSGVRAVEAPLAGFVEATPAERLGGGGSGRSRSAVLVVSPAQLTSNDAESLRSLTGAGDGPFLVRVDGEEFHAQVAGLREIDLRGKDEADIVAELRARLGISGPLLSNRERSLEARFPPDEQVVMLPGRNPLFAGRSEFLRDLRRRLGTGQESSGRVLLLAEEPLGKSEIALEYGHRFLGAYDIVCWIPSESLFKAREALRQLAERLGLGTVEDRVGALLSYLADSRAGRWLLVYDDVRDHEELREIIPTVRAFGHVIVTSREAAGWDEVEGRVRVEPLSPEDGIELLKQAEVSIGDDDAARIVTTVGHLPLAVEMARVRLSANLRDAGQPRGSIEHMRDVAVEDFLENYRRAAAGLQAREEKAPVSPHRVMIEIAIEALRRNSRGAAAQWLLEICAQLSLEGIALPLLRSATALSIIAEKDDECGDVLMVDAVLNLIHNHALARVELGQSETVRLPRLVAESLLDRMSDEDRRTRASEVHRILAGYAPSDPGEGAPDSSAMRAFAELGKHVLVSRAYESTDQMIGRWIILQLRYLFLLDEKSAWTQARELGTRTLSHWEERQPHSPLLAELRMQLSSVHRTLGDYELSLDLSQKAFRELVASRRPNPRRFVAATLLAADLRFNGDFDGAYNWDSMAWEGTSKLLGPDHAWTGRVLNNLALSASLNAKPHQALRNAQKRFDDRVRLYGKGDRQAWWSACNTAHYLRDLWRPQDSYDLLKVGIAEISRLGKTDGTRRDLLQLHLENGLGISERLLGRPVEASIMNKDVFNELHALYGEQYLYTMICAASVADDLHARGDHDAAVACSRKNLRNFTARFGEHPIRYASQVNLAIHLLGQGEVQESSRLAEESHDWLRSRLGSRHPFTLAASITLANSVVTTDADRAIRLESLAVDDLSRLYVNPEHRHIRVARENLANSRRRKISHPAAFDARRGEVGIEILGY